MPITAIDMGTKFLADMESYYGQSSQSPDKCTEAGEIAAYVRDAISIEAITWNTDGLTGMGAANAMGTSDISVSSFMDGVMDYLTTAFQGAIDPSTGSEIVTPIIDATMAFSAGAGTCTGDIVDPQPLNILCDALITTLGNYTLTSVMVVPPPTGPIYAIASVI